MSKFVKVAGAVMLLSAAVSVTADARPAGFQLRCTPGPNMVARVSHETNAEHRILSTVFDISFDVAPQAGSAAEPPPGSCAWLDRPLQPDEPHRIWAKGDGAGLSWRLTQGGAVPTGAVGPEWERQRMETLARYVTGTASFTIWVENTNGVLAVTATY
jgi:hypothetical protein